MNYLREHKTITQDEAKMHLGIGRLSARIFDLRKDGVNIVTGEVECVNRFGEPSSYAVYYIPEVLEATDVLQELC